MSGEMTIITTILLLFNFMAWLLNPPVQEYKTYGVGGGYHKHRHFRR